MGVLSLAIVAVALTACYDDPFSPYWDHGTFYLVYANNRHVPTTVSGGLGPNTPSLEVTRGTLTLRRDHSYQLLVDVREWDAGGGLYESTKVYAGQYETEDRAIYLTYFESHEYYSSVMVANWRNGRVEVVVPNLDGRQDVLCVFED
jgi:hypothetical protein